MTSLDTIVRFHHPERSPDLIRLGVAGADLTAVIARGLAVTSREIELRRELLARRVRDSVTSLLADPDVVETVANLPFRDGDVVVAFGDSMTDDLLSWAAQLSLLLALAMPDRRVRVVNAGHSGDTTADAIDRLDLVIAERPTWVVQLLGTNDARRHGRDAHQVFTRQETARNFRTIHSVLTQESDVRVIRMRPPPILDQRVGESVDFAEQGVTWRSEEVRAVGLDLAESDSTVIDLYELMLPDADVLIGEDGVHLTLAGQRVVLEALLRALAASA